MPSFQTIGSLSPFDLYYWMCEGSASGGIDEQFQMESLTLPHTDGEHSLNIPNNYRGHSNTPTHNFGVLVQAIGDTWI